MIVVVDTNVFISAARSRAGFAWHCFVLLAEKQFQLAVTREILEEYELVAERQARAGGILHGKNWRALYQWLHRRALYVEAAPLGKPRSRDAKDDIFLACALAARAEIIVSFDNDLLALKKPFGIEMLKPSAFAAKMRSK